MVQTDAASSTRGGVGVWIFRVLVVAAAAFMVYSWFQPWWSAKVAVIPGDNHLVLHPWGVDVVSQVRANIDESAFSMPFPNIFAGFMWVYLAVCLLGLAASLFITKRFSIGRINISAAMLIIVLVGLSYMAAVGLAYGIGTIKASLAGANFIGKSNVPEPQSGAKIKMVSGLLIGYWISLAAGGAVFLVGLIRPIFIRKPKAAAVPQA